MDLIKCIDVAVSYSAEPVVEHLDLTIKKGMYLCFIGENGSGKTTLMKAILGLVPVSQGKIEKSKDLAGCAVCCRSREKPRAARVAFRVALRYGRAARVIAIFINSTRRIQKNATAKHRPPFRFPDFRSVVKQQVSCFHT